jgi:hypothetical protein
LCPSISGPQEAQKSIYSFPSASVTKAPFPFVIKTGVPSTLLNALTGELTPPGKYLEDVLYYSDDFDLFIMFNF